MGCSVAIADLMSPMRAYGETIATVFAEHTDFQHTAMQIYQVVRDIHPAGDLLDSPIFRPMRKFLPLQAADLVAYESYKEAERRYYEPNKKPRWGFTELQDILKLSSDGLDPFMIYRNEEIIKIHMTDAQRRINDAIIGKRN